MPTTADRLCDVTQEGQTRVTLRVRLKIISKCRNFNANSDKANLVNYLVKLSNTDENLHEARFEEHTLEAQELSRVEATVVVEDDREVIVQELALVRARYADLELRLEEAEGRVATVENEKEEMKRKLEIVRRVVH
ncbi:unnamed protein product [Brachionus calyciflorus]|uniref:Uncharacterized protein n=1 Tax=Brachionus calyciflorus TaxID=104777 RepID=A0A814FZT9_9BILA|nr:unnamed protein product [Brachionus calyciflorus]